MPSPTSFVCTEGCMGTSTQIGDCQSQWLNPSSPSDSESRWLNSRVNSRSLIDLSSHFPFCFCFLKMLSTIFLSKKNLVCQSKPGNPFDEGIFIVNHLVESLNGLVTWCHGFPLNHPVRLGVASPSPSPSFQHL